MEAEGFALPVIEAHCDVPPAGAVRRRARGADERARCCRRCACSSTTRSCAPPTAPSLADRAHRARGARSRTAGRAGCPSACVEAASCFVMKALVTGVAGFIGSTLAERLLARRRRRRRHRLLHRLLPARRSRSGTWRRSRATRASASSSRGFRTPTCRRCSRDRTHVFHLAAQAGVRKSWGRDFAVYTRNNIEATQVLLEAVRRASRSSGSSTRRARRSTATTSRMPMREDALPQPVSPYGVTKLAAEQLCYLYYVNYGVPAVSLRYFTVYGPRQRPDMGFHKFLRATLRGEPITRVRRRRADARLHVRRRRGRRDNLPAATPGRSGPRVQYWRRIAGLGQRGARDDRPRRRAARRVVTVDPAQKGDMRHTYADTSLARADLGFAPTRRPRRRTGGRVSHGWRKYCDDRLRTHSPACVLARCSPWRCCRLRLPAHAARRSCRRAPAEPDKFLFDKGTEALNEKKWLTAREFFKQVTETYTQSPYRPDAKLGIGDTYLGEGTAEALVLAINEFREFLSFYPTNPRADYAQYKLGHGALPADARAAARSDRNARGDQGVRDVRRRAIPNSSLMPEVKAKLREARDRLSEVELPGRLLLLPPALVSGRDRSLQGAAEGRSGVHRPRRASTSTSAESLVKIEARRPKRCPTSRGWSRNSSRASTCADAQKRIAELKAQAQVQVNAEVRVMRARRCRLTLVRDRRRAAASAQRPAQSAQTPVDALTPLEIAVACAPPTVLSTRRRHRAARHRRAGHGRPHVCSATRDLLVIDGGSRAGRAARSAVLHPPRRCVSAPIGKTSQRCATTRAGFASSRVNEHDGDRAESSTSAAASSTGDYLEPFVGAGVPAGADRDDAAGEPDFTALGHVIVRRRRARHPAAPATSMLIDWGRVRRCAPGARFADLSRRRRRRAAARQRRRRRRHLDGSDGASRAITVRETTRSSGDLRRVTRSAIAGLAIRRCVAGDADVGDARAEDALKRRK